MESRFYTAKDIANLLGVGVGKGYSLIREWNKEKKKKTKNKKNLRKPAMDNTTNVKNMKKILPYA